MHYKLSGTGELVYPSKLVPGLVLSQIYTFQDFVWVLKKTIAALPRAKACSWGIGILLYTKPMKGNKISCYSNKHLACKFPQYR